MRAPILLFPLFVACAASTDPPSEVEEPKTVQGTIAGKRVPELLGAVIDERQSSVSSDTSLTKTSFKIFVGEDGLGGDFCKYRDKEAAQSLKKARFVIEVRSTVPIESIAGRTHYDVCPPLGGDSDCVNVKWLVEAGGEFNAQYGGALLEQKDDGVIDVTFGVDSNAGHIEGRLAASQCPKPAPDFAK